MGGWIVANVLGCEIAVSEFDSSPFISFSFGLIPTRKI